MKKNTHPIEIRTGRRLGTCIRIVHLCLLHQLSLTIASAQASATSISFQGALNQLNGAPLANSEYSLTFRFYASATTNGPVYGNARTNVNAVPITNGLVSTSIPVQAEWFDGQSRWLGVSINGAAELVPRVMVTAVPYAIRANSLGTSVVVDAKGNVGIGIQEPSAKLDVAGTMAADYLSLNPENPNFGEGGEMRLVGTAGHPNWITDVYYDQFRIFNQNSERVPLSVSGSSGVTTLQYLSLDIVDDVRGEGGELQIRGTHGHPTWWLDVRNDDFRLFNSDSGRVPFSINSGTAVTTVKVLRIEGGSDLAEPFDVTTPSDTFAICPGLVMVIDREIDGKLAPCDRPYDTAVAGIISGANGLQPGMVMKAEGKPHAEGEHPVAMTGRVWCYADASHGAIRRGDRLTTSSTLGHAMKAADLLKADGAVIGKAMTELTSGTGLVLVLVNLQ